MTIRKYLVFVSSPGDCEKYREAVVQVINSLNEENALEEWSFAPVRYERQVALGAGVPQDRINRLLDRCDLLVGIFNAKIGTPTKNYASGTVEEIEIMRNKGKPTLVYFNANPNPDKTVFAQEQYEQVKRYKKSLVSLTYDSYKKASDFKESLKGQLLKYISDPATFKDPKDRDLSKISAFRETQLKEMNSFAAALRDAFNQSSIINIMNGLR